MPQYTPKEKPVKNTPWPLKPEPKPTKEELEDAFKKAFTQKKESK